MTKFARIVFVALLGIATGVAGSVPALAQSVLNAKFTSTPITVDGVAEAAWNSATAQNISICMNPALTQQLSSCAVKGTVKALWNGPLLYLLFNVTDPDISVSAGSETDRSSVKVFVDQYDDKFSKFEEDDGYFVVSASGVQTGNNTNAGLTYFPTVWHNHLQSYAAAYTLDGSGHKTGYTVEVGWYIGDRPLQNDTKIGMEFAINASSASKNALQYQLYWSSGNNKGTDNNTMWGDVLLTGYDGSSPMQLNKFMLSTNIAKATASPASSTGLVRGIWTDETALDTALQDANNALASATTQQQIDTANTALDTALRGLRRSGKYPDPYDLPSVPYLPDPFTFFNGTKVKSLADWTTRREEIKDLAQYYEFGYMPAPPESLTAVSTSATSGSLTYKSIAISIKDKGKSASFTPILYLPTTGKAPYPVIVELDMFANPYFAPANTTYTNAGYAVLSVPTSDYSIYGLPGTASDDGNHTGAFFNLYPYDLSKGQDTGVLMAWSWGASRAVDALQYLTANDATYAGLLDLDKLVVTGFSRWGKASLVAGMMDERFKVTAPGGSGSGGAAPYRYDAYGNTPFRSAPFGNIYPWGHTPGGEVMGDHVRHQTHNSNEMIRRFLNDTIPAAVQQRMYKTNTWGYGDRMPFDHHEEIAAIAPRAVIIDNTNDDYADNVEGDSIGYEGAMPVYQFLGATQKLALDIYMGGGGHSLKPSQAVNIVNFSNFILFGKPLADDVKTQITTDPYLNAATYNTYYGGFATMMPWASDMPHANLLTSLTLSAASLSPVFAEATTTYTASVAYGVTSTTVTVVSEDSKAVITVNGQTVTSGQPSPAIALVPGPNVIAVVVAATDGVTRTYQVTVNEAGAITTTALASSNLNANLKASVTFTATVTATVGAAAPTGTVTFLDGTTTLGTGTLSAAGTTASTATFATAALAAGKHTITAAFNGSPAFVLSTSTALTQTVIAPSISGAFSPDVIGVAKGSSGTTTLTLTPVGGYTGTVTLACGALPVANLTCAFAPASLTFTGTNAVQTSTFTVGTRATAGVSYPALPGSRSTPGTALGFLAFPFIGLLALAGRRKSGARDLFLLVVLAVSSIGIVFATSGCGGASKTAASGMYLIPVTVTDGTTTSTVSVSVVVH